jgi:hypothetical protein
MCDSIGVILKRILKIGVRILAGFEAENSVQ